MRRALVARVAIATALVAACATVGELPVIDGGTPPASVPPTGDDGGTVPDAATLVDTGGPFLDTDASDGGGYCALLAPSPTFCADFDEGKPLAAGFGGLTLDPGATAQLGAASKSPPYAFNALTPALTAGQGSHNLLTVTLGAAATTATLAFDVRLAAAYVVGPNSQITLARVRFPGTAALYFIQFGIYGGQGQVIEATVPTGGTAAYVPHDSAFVAAGTWVHVSIAVTLGAPGRIILSYDGTTALDTSLNPSAGSAIPTAQVGLDVGGVLDPINASFDNFVLRSP